MAYRAVYDPSAEGGMRYEEYAEPGQMTEHQKELLGSKHGFIYLSQTGKFYPAPGSRPDVAGLASSFSGATGANPQIGSQQEWNSVNIPDPSGGSDLMNILKVAGPVLGAAAMTGGFSGFPWNSSPTSTTFGLNPGYETAVAGTSDVAGGGMELFDPWGAGDTSSWQTLMNQPGTPVDWGGGYASPSAWTAGETPWWETMSTPSLGSAVDPYGLGWTAPTPTGNSSWDAIFSNGASLPAGGPWNDFAVNPYGSGVPSGSGVGDFLKKALGMLGGGGSGGGQRLSGGSDLARLLGGIGSAGLGAYAANKQAEALKELAQQQMAAEQGRFDTLLSRADQATQRGIEARTQAQGVVAPSQARYEGSFAPGFTMSNDPGFTDALNQSSKATLHGLSVNGNPAGSPNAWAQSLQDNFAKFAYPALQNYRSINAQTGFSGPYAGVAAAAPGMNATQYGNPNAGSDASAASIGANSNVFGALGKGIANVTNPTETLADVIARMSKGNNVFAY